MDKENITATFGCIIPLCIFVVLPLTILIYKDVSGIDGKFKKIEKRQDSIEKVVNSLKTDTIEAEDECEYCEDDKYFIGTPVYVCGGKYAKCYHKDVNCPGLESCKGKIVVKDDFNVGKLRPCKICALDED